jgi:C_GCAxxG_C_C family probable redox protein
MAEALTAGMGGGLGGSGCLCGAVNGAVVALGLFLKGCESKKQVSAKIVRAHTRELEKTFTAHFGATCCRILSKKDKSGNQTKRQRCADQTAFAAELAAKIILHRRPDIADRADLDYLEQRHGRAATYLKMIAGRY